MTQLPNAFTTDSANLKESTELEEATSADVATPLPLSDEEAKELAQVIANAADDRKAEDIVILEVTGVSYLADYFVIATGFSTTQVRAISRSVEQAVHEKYDRHPLHTEGTGENRWVLQDYGEVIVHIFLPDEREYYNLESFWAQANPIPFVPPSPATTETLS